MKKLFFIASVAFFTLSMNGCGNHSESGHHEGGGHHAEAYQCPMKCEGEKTYDKEGKCPVCNMALKEVEHSH